MMWYIQGDEWCKIDVLDSNDLQASNSNLALLKIIISVFYWLNSCSSGSRHCVAQG